MIDTHCNVRNKRSPKKSVMWGIISFTIITLKDRIAILQHMYSFVLCLVQLWQILRCWIPPITLPPNLSEPHRHLSTGNASHRGKRINKKRVAYVLVQICLPWHYTSRQIANFDILHPHQYGFFVVCVTHFQITPNYLVFQTTQQQMHIFSLLKILSVI